MLSFKKVLNDLKPSVFFIEESKMKTAGKINLENYIIFEKLRSNNENGGGLAIGCIPELKPCWVRESQEPVEALSIDIFVKNLKIRCCVGYGFQENYAIDQKEAFWDYLDNEVMEAKKMDQLWLYTWMEIFGQVRKSSLMTPGLKIEKGYCLNNF